MSTTKTQHQPARAKRHGNEGSYASNETNNPSTPPTTSGPTNSRKAPEARRRPRPGRPTPTHSARTYNTPGELLNAAAQLSEEEARRLLLGELLCNGWKAASLEMLMPNSRFRISWPKPQVAYWIERLSCAVSHIGDLSFGDLERLAALWCSSIDATNEYDDVKALKLVTECENSCSSTLHARRIRHWAVGNLWTCMVIEPPASETLEVWFRDFRAQSEAERGVLRRLWHDDHEQVEFDALPEEVLLHRSFRSAPLVAGLSLQDELDTSLAYETSVALRDPTNPLLGRPHVESLLAKKNLIVGLKKVYGPCEEDLSLHAVTLPWTEDFQLAPAAPDATSKVMAN